jgi:glycosyltransferase involved in cell wall biosynthesis
VHSSPVSDEVIRIVFLVRTLSDRAISRLTVALAREMGEQGHDVTIVSLSRARGAPDAVPNVQLVNLDTGKEISFRAVRGLQRWIGRQDPDVIFCQGPGPGRAAVLARMMTRRDLRIAVVDHNPPWTPFSRLNVVLRRADVLAAPTESAAQRFSERLGAAEVAVLPDPILGDAAASARPAHRWYTEGDPVICSVANIIPRKGQDVLIRALKHLNARLVLVGRVDDASYLSSLKELAGQLGVLDRVWFVGYQDDPLPFVRHADAFALGSRSESFGMVLAEAMACGTPVVATDCPDGPRHVLDEGRAGVLVAMDDPKAMAAALRRVLEDETTRFRLIETGRRTVASLSVKRVADRYLNALQRRPLERPHGLAGLAFAMPLVSLLDGGGVCDLKVLAIADVVCSNL